MRSFKFIFILTILFLAHFSSAQENENSIQIDDTPLTVQTIEDDDLKTYKNDKDFDYTETKEEETIIDKFFAWLANVIQKFFEAIFGVGKVDGLLYFIFNILPYLLLAFLVFLLIRFFLKVNSQNVISATQNSPLVEFTEEERIIKQEDIKALINDAIKQKNFRLAIRYYYLLTLKYLTEKQHIEWEQQKTNNDYITEIKKDTLRSGFKDLTLIYDYVWYGEFAIDEMRFNALRSSFDILNKTINPNE